MRRLDIAIALYVMGYCVFTTAAYFDIYHEWDTAYFIWSSFAHGGLVIWWALYGLVPKSRKIDVGIVCGLAASLCIWEVVSWLSGIDINNEIAVLVEFLGAIVVFTYYLYAYFKEKFKYL